MHRAALYITWIQSIICCVLAAPAHAQLTGQKVLEGLGELLFIYEHLKKPI